MTARNSDQGWSERHASAVRDAAPDVPRFADDQRRALWQQVVTTAGRRVGRRRRRRWRSVVAGVVAVGAVGAAGAAAGTVISAHTGRGPVDAEDAELGGPGERLDPRAPDFALVLAEETADIPFPSAATRDSALSWEVEDQTRGAGQVSTGALRLWMAGHALCAWSNTWAVALHSRDDAGEATAADVILGARRWSSITDTDPDLADESEFAWLPDLERAVRDGDPAGAREALARNGSCLPGLAPELGLGKRW
ncbi:hypothetical protein [Nocardioides aquiterrae]|uniref:Uncharacterized protein n=1 Tax=Nocardioides aquiterrae TaxID=203799 RepID=A0ABP4EV83_9ACTN